MTTPYAVASLDAFINAAIEWTGHHGSQFYAGNIAGREGLPDDVEEVKRMADWLVETDRGLLETLGFGTDDITYYRLGHDARRVMTTGGFAAYFRRKRRTKQREQFRTWVPICTAVIAILFTALTYFAPRRSDEKVDELREQVLALRRDMNQTTTLVQLLQARSDSLLAVTRKK
jgi:hypothetical protein